MSQLSDDNPDKQVTCQPARAGGRQQKFEDIIAARNDTLPVARIPDDVYFEIFRLFAPSAMLGVHEDTRDTRAISQVNRRWRTVAIDLPFLWTRIPLHSCLPHIHLMLQRSRSTSVRLDADLPLMPTARAGIEEMVAPHIHRVCSLALRSSDETEDAKRDARSLLQIVASSRALESLFLSGVDVSYAPDDGGLDVPPKLHRFRMVNCIPQNASALLYHPLGHVTHFSLSCAQKHRARDLNWTQLLILLSYMPLLETLIISDTDLKAAHHAGPPAKALALPRLALFRADRVRAHYLRHLLLHLHVPSTANFRFTNSGSGIPRLSQSVFAGAQRLMLARNPNTDPLRSTVRLSAHRDLRPLPSEPPVKTVFFFPKADPLQCLRDFGRATADARSLKTVQIHDFDVPDATLAADVGLLAQRLVEHVGKCEALLMARCSPRLLTAIVVELRGGQDGGSPERMCPFLERLEIWETRFRDAAQARELVSSMRSMTDCRRSARVARMKAVALGDSQLFGEVFENIMSLHKRLKTEH